MIVLMRNKDKKMFGCDFCFNIRSGCYEFGEVNYVRLVQEKFLNYFYLGEEIVIEKEFERFRSGLKDFEWIWIVDFIDGIFNFVSDYVLFCV